MYKRNNTCYVHKTSLFVEFLPTETESYNNCFSASRYPPPHPPWSYHITLTTFTLFLSAPTLPLKPNMVLKIGVWSRRSWRNRDSLSMCVHANCNSCDVCLSMLPSSNKLCCAVARILVEPSAKAFTFESNESWLMLLHAQTLANTLYWWWIHTNSQLQNVTLSVESVRAWNRVWEWTLCYTLHPYHPFM